MYIYIKQNGGRGTSTSHTFVSNRTIGSDIFPSEKFIHTFCKNFSIACINFLEQLKIILY
jgi:hypothetical protein